MRPVLIALAASSAAAALASPAAAKGPGCSDSSVVKTVLELAKKRNPLPSRFSYFLDSIRATGTTPDGTSCAADLERVYGASTVYSVRSITYIVTTNAEGMNEVTVSGLGPPSR